MLLRILVACIFPSTEDGAGFKGRGPGGLMPASWTPVQAEAACDLTSWTPVQAEAVCDLTSWTPVQAEDVGWSDLMDPRPG